MLTLFSLVFLFFLPFSLLVAPSGLVMGEDRAVLTSPLSVPVVGSARPGWVLMILCSVTTPAYTLGRSLT